MKSWNFVFLFLLVCSLGLPSINFVYAEPITNLVESGEIINAIEDQTLNDGIIINEGGELIIDSGVTLKVDGVLVNSGKITIDGDLIVNGLIINNFEINVRCGVFDTTGAPILGNDLEFISCENSSNEILLDDFTIVSGETLHIAKNKILVISGTLIIEGTLENFGSIENKGGILFNGGTIKNLGKINSLCENFEVRGIIAEGEIFGSGEFTGTTCSAPVSVDDDYSINEDEILTVDVIVGVLANDSDADTDSTDLKTKITINSISGTTILNTDGSFTYIPDPDYFGTDSFEYKVSDGTGGKTTGLVTLDVLPVSEIPVSVNDAYSTDEDTLLVVSAAEGVLTNDSDADTDSTDLIATITFDSTHGKTVLNADGSFTYTPVLDYVGTDSFEYKVSDGENEVTASVVIDVLPINDAPTAANDAYSTDEDTPLTVSAPGVLANDADVDSTTLTVEIIPGSTSGIVELESDGVFTYTPVLDYVGTDSFEYKVSDGEHEVTASVAIDVLPINDAPTAANDAYSTDEDTPLTVSAPGVLANDVDVDDTEFTLTITIPPTSGTTDLNNDGSLTYTPNPDYVGTDSFEYKVSDGENKVTATVAIDVLPINDAPTAANDAYSGNEDEILAVGTPGVLTNDADVDSANLTVKLATGSASGTTSLNADGSFTYTPNPDFFGTDSFEYKVSDGEHEVTASVILTLIDTFDDTEPPVLSDLSDIIIEADSLETLRSAIDLSVPTVNDNADPTPTLLNDSPDVFLLGDTTVTWTATDSSGNSATTTQLVRVLDSVAPIIIVPADVVLSIEGTEISTSSLFDLGEATATDNVDLNPIITNDAPKPFLLGDTTVTWTATDASGNVATAIQLVTLEDETSPVITVPSDISMEATGFETPQSSVSLGDATANDNADPSPIITNDSPVVYLLGNTNIVWTATDASGNVATAIQLVTLEDETSPVITAPSNVLMSINGFELSASLVSLGEATAIDIVDATLTIINNAPEVFLVGDTTVTWTATDASGNTATTTQVVTIEHIALLDQKISLTQQIESMIGDATHEDSTYELEKAIKDITKSIDQTKWEENKDSLNTDDGKKVFDDQRKGVKHIIKVLEAGNESDQFLFDLANILLEMVNIDMQLAENSFYNASNSQDADKKCIDKASNELEKAEKYQSENKFDKAIEHYGKVWENSKKSHDKPAKGQKSPCDPRRH